MSQNPRQSGADALIKKLHERPHVPLADWPLRGARTAYIAEKPSVWRTRRHSAS